MKKKIKRITAVALILFGIGFFVFAGFFLYVRQEVKSQIDRGIIDNIIFSESPVYYTDNITPIGVYFEKIHSKYVKYGDIPPTYIKALIASEDADFFSHSGFDIKAIARAFIANFKAGRVVQGGSTITQQTAKNVFKREKSGYISKVKELFQGFILEYFYTKEEILEMYINQFEVTGFGKGLRIASEYFFNKDVKDLSLVEAAFIAGMVKGPYKYNPFTKNTDEKKKQAVEYANIRKNYVLKNMRKEKFISSEEYIEAKDQDVPFKEGKVTYRLNVILDYIRDQLESDYFKTILHKEGIDNIATSGIKIYTSINKDIQEKALKSVRKNLPLLDIRLSGMDTSLFRERYIHTVGTYYTNPQTRFPFFVEIKKIINKKGKEPEISVSWGEDTIGTVDIDEFKNAADAWAHWKYGYNYRSGYNYLNEFIKNFKEGDSIPVILSETDESKVSLAPIPELEGSVVILKNGMIKAMVGGYFNRHLNRAVNAKRQLGSIFKPIVYSAALQLKWHSLDKLNNFRDLYTFENTNYLPDPDHEPESDIVSMTWAGVKSENLASVWLLYHLTDKLNMSEFRQVSEILGLSRGDEESYDDYVTRIRDRHGVIVTVNAIKNAAFNLALKTIESDLLFDDNLYALENINRLHPELGKKGKEFIAAKYSEGSIKRTILRYNFERLVKLNSQMTEELKDINLLFTLYSDDPSPIEKKLEKALNHLFVLKTEDGRERIIYTENPLNIQGRAFFNITINDLLKRKNNFRFEDIWIDDLVPSGTIDDLQTYIAKHYKELTSYSRYDMKVLSQIRDFKTLVNISYVKQLAKNIGIDTWLDSDLSFPLGPDSISIIEGALAYQSILSGDFHSIPDIEKNNSMTPVITRITDRNDVVLWEYKPDTKKVMSKTVSASIIEILRKVIENGTGRRAKDAIKMTLDFESGKMELPVRCYGKTGTANRFTNSSFVGFIPGLDDVSGEFDLNQGYVIAAYVGYDNNFPMKNKSFSISGASGALPIWIDSTKGIVDSDEYKKGIHISDLAFISTSRPLMTDGMESFRVSTIDGLPLGDSEEKDSKKVTDVYAFGKTDQMIPAWNREFTPLKGTDNEKNN
ncbi:MAG: transglycosylase domain-containing protein [Desulfobacteraceae bacterium]|jgi:membrane peptidoglycan carboxypeptidase